MAGVSIPYQGHRCRGPSAAEPVEDISLVRRRNQLQSPSPPHCTYPLTVCVCVCVCVCVRSHEPVCPIRGYILTNFFRHFLQFLLRSTHDHYIQSTFGQLQK